MWKNSDEALQERFALAMERIYSIRASVDVKEPYLDYFQTVAAFICKVKEIAEKDANRTLEELEEDNRKLYEDIAGDHYEKSYANPAYSTALMGEEFGRLFSMLYAQMYQMILFAYAKRLENFTVYAELFIEIYNLMEQEETEFSSVKDAVYWFFSDYSDLFVRQQVEDLLITGNTVYEQIIEQSDEDLRYLYKYGMNVTENERKMAKFLNEMDKETLKEIAATFVNGYCRGFEVTKRDLSKKDRFELRYAIGLEPLIKASLPLWKEKGLKPTYRHITITTTPANRQFEYDHRYDQAVYLDKQYKERRSQVLRVTYEEHKKEAQSYAGPVVLETFGEVPFEPKNNGDSYRLDEKQQNISIELSNETRSIMNEYIPEDETSFTIIAFPIPEIGDCFEEIFRETMKVNTLDNERYIRIQQKIIDALDQGRFVKVKGKGENKTDLVIQLHQLTDPEKQTNFENCTADVNIPVGEVFTSPVLKGTNGILHISRVFMRGLEYKELELTFKDGMISDYTCKNFDSEEENKAYIKENLMYHRESLPMGEFAIGTNTTAYAMAQKYNIFKRLPILIAEKTGPHFAVGDTCYSHSEDLAVFNPDGKEIIARENECSALRKTDPQKAYFSCHTDATIPYDELGAIDVVRSDGTEIPIIRDSRFVLPGTEELNEALEIE
ncbi:Thermophilic metalloprotease (M29) [Clostridiales bacterium CHKCI001]|nr:Thermophilic metalloprotease (M29) [Clostridiales bacterium CHKCI001]